MVQLCEGVYVCGVTHIRPYFIEIYMYLEFYLHLAKASKLEAKS